MCNCALRIAPEMKTLSSKCSRKEETAFSCIDSEEEKRKVKIIR
jgi:hypothetical protein